MTSTSPRSGRLLALAVALCALTAGVAINYQTRPDASQAPVLAEKGEDAPAIKLKTLDGKDYDLAKDPNKVVVIDFWATWCGPCRKGLPKLQSTYDWVTKEKLKVSIYPINIQEQKDEVQEFWTDAKLTMPVLMDIQGDVASKYRVRAIPNTLVIVNGKIAESFVGLASEEAIKKAIENGRKQAESAPAQKPADK